MNLSVKDNWLWVAGKDRVLSLIRLSQWKWKEKIRFKRLVFFEMKSLQVGGLPDVEEEVNFFKESRWLLT